MYEQNNRPYKPNKNKEAFKPTILTYEKSFSDFEAMIIELRALHPELSNIFCYDYDEDEYTPEYAIVDILNYFGQNYPNINTRANLPVALSVSSNIIKYKTNNFYAFKYEFKYDRNGYISDVKAEVTVYSRDERNTNEINNMIDILSNEWNKVTYNKKH